MLFSSNRCDLRGMASCIGRRELPLPACSFLATSNTKMHLLE